MTAGGIRLGCAGWSLPREHWPAFGAQGTHLMRYATRLPAVEINTSFYRPHRPETYRKWADSVPATFRFCVKVPKQITHAARLVDCEALLETFLAQCGALGERLDCLLVQLPPSLAYDAEVARAFFGHLRARYAGNIALEPRHASWQAAEALLVEQRIARVAADPPPVAHWDEPGGWSGLRYYRLHGSPRLYFSAYEPAWLEALARRLETALADGAQVWCIFDNTASGAATGNALDLLERMGE